MQEERYRRQNEPCGRIGPVLPQNWKTVPPPSVADAHKSQYPNSAGNVISGSRTSTPSSNKQASPQPQNLYRRPVEIFMAYTGAREDRTYFSKIDTLVKGIKQQCSDWNIDYKNAQVYEEETPLRTRHFLTSAHLAILLVSRTFVSTDFSTCQQMREAVDRHGPNFCLLPIRIHPIGIWKNTLFGHLEALPEGGKAFSELGSRQSQALNRIQEIIVEKVAELRLSNGMY